jgi:hypothetical protein
MKYTPAECRNISYEGRKDYGERYLMQFTSPEKRAAAEAGALDPDADANARRRKAVPRSVTRRNGTAKLRKFPSHLPKRTRARETELPRMRLKIGLIISTLIPTRSQKLITKKVMRTGATIFRLIFPIIRFYFFPDARRLMPVA